MVFMGRSGWGMSANVAEIIVPGDPFEGVFLWAGTLNNDINT